MGNVTIINGLETFTFQPGDVTSVKVLKQGSLDVNPMPASDSDDAFVIDFNGVLKTITLMGDLSNASSTRVSGGSVSTIAEQIDWLLTLVDGAQTGYTFGSTFQTGKTVYCRKVDFDELQGEITKSPFTIEFVEGV